MPIQSLKTNYQPAPTPATNGHLPPIGTDMTGLISRLRSFLGSPSVGAIGPSETDVATLLSSDFAIVDQGMDAELQKAFDSGAIERGSPQEAALRASLGSTAVAQKLSATVALRHALFSEFLNAVLQGSRQSLSYEGMLQQQAVNQHEILNSRINVAIQLAQEERMTWQNKWQAELEKTKLSWDVLFEQFRVYLTQRGQDADAAIARANAQNMIGASAVLANIPPGKVPDPGDAERPTQGDIFNGDVLDDLEHILDGAGI